MNPGWHLVKGFSSFFLCSFYSPSGNTEISLRLFMLRFSKAIMVSCSGISLCLCFPLPFVEQHGMAVHLFMIYFTQWLGPDYTDKHSRLSEGQLDLCNDTQSVPRSWEGFQSKKGQWQIPLRPPPGHLPCPLSQQVKTNVWFFYSELFCNFQHLTGP